MTGTDHQDEEPMDTWSTDFLEALGSWNEAIERPAQHSIAQKRDPFDTESSAFA
jgi:hypothetical protein